LNTKNTLHDKRLCTLLTYTRRATIVPQ
jgi:hypothetical protein